MGFESNPINLLKSKMDIFEGYVSFELTRFCSVAHQYIKYRRNWSRFIENFTFYGITSLKEKSKYSQFRYSRFGFELYESVLIIKFYYFCKRMHVTTSCLSSFGPR